MEKSVLSKKCIYIVNLFSENIVDRPFGSCLVISRFLDCKALVSYMPSCILLHEVNLLFSAVLWF